MKGFILSLQSEFYKSRKTLGFWSAILLPLIICLLVFTGFYSGSDKMQNTPPMILWMGFADSILFVMSILLLPIFVVFVGYSVNSMEHKADTWKTLFSLPISKWSIYAAKYIYALLLIFICLLLFLLFTLGFGNLWGLLKPQLKLDEYHVENFLVLIYLKFFLASLGILSIQFLLSLLWSDFLKPMGVGFVCTIAGDIMGKASWKYAYLFPYAHPFMALQSMHMTKSQTKTIVLPQLTVDLFTKETYVGLAIAVVVFIAGFFIVRRKSVK